VFFIERTLELKDTEQAAELFGSFDENIKLIEKEWSVQVLNRGAEIKILGEEEMSEKAYSALSALISLMDKGEKITDQLIRYVISLTNEGNLKNLTDLAGDCILITSKGRALKPKTIGQKKYTEAIEKNTITIAIGPAGTGKTYLAVALAVKAFRNHEISRIILTRPAVEAGEKLGFLPGDLQNKVDPYLRPLYDALLEMFGAEGFQKHFERGSIEVAPLAYMRGRTLDDSFIILDEAQNTTKEQMKMFLTRMGFNSKVVITGDSTQIDLPSSHASGLLQAARVLKNIDDIAIVKLDNSDVVRHHLVQKIVKAYEKYETQAEKRRQNEKN
jgi:phosphate starvation-inducible PhoH-like protein